MSWLFTSVAEDLNSGRPRDQIEQVPESWTKTRDCRIASPMRWLLLGHAAFLDVYVDHI